MIGKLQLGAGSGAGLEGGGHFGKRDSIANPFFCLGEPLLGGFEFAAGGAPALADVAAAAERARRVSGQMTGHLGEVVVAGAAEAQRPRQRRGGRLGQVAQKGQARLFGGVLVVKRLDGVAASVGLRPQPRGLLAQGVGAVAVVYLDVQQGQIPPAGRDANRRRIYARRQVADHYRPQPRLHVHRAAAPHPGAVYEDGHGRDRCVQGGALHHRPLLAPRALSSVQHTVPVSAHRVVSSPPSGRADRNGRQPRARLTRCGNRSPQWSVQAPVMGTMRWLCPRAWWLLPAAGLVLVTAACGVRPAPANAARPSGSAALISGMVQASPGCPVERQNPACRPRRLGDVQVEARSVPTGLTATTRARADGHYAFRLRPGRYVLVAAPRQAIPRCPHVLVSVTSPAPVRININCDSGIR